VRFETSYKPLLYHTYGERQRGFASPSAKPPKTEFGLDAFKEVFALFLMAHGDFNYSKSFRQTAQKLRQGVFEFVDLGSVRGEQLVFIKHADKSMEEADERNVVRLVLKM